VHVYIVVTDTLGDVDALNVSAQVIRHFACAKSKNRVRLFYSLLIMLESN